MNNNLVAEKRPDKHGNLVTRWIRSFTGRDTAKDIPAPALPDATKLRPVPMTKARKQQYKDLANLLRENIEFGMVSAIEKQLKTIAEYDPYLLDRITESTHEHVSEREFWAKTLATRAVLSGEYQKHLKQTLDKYHAAFVVNPLVKRIADNGGSIGGNVFSAINIGDTVNNITRGEVTRSDVDEGFEATITAVAMIVYLKNLHVDTPWDDEENRKTTNAQILESAKYIATRVDEVERILPELYQRGTYDRETIDILLNAPAPSLMEGLL